jgi:hypothetical protein
MHRKDRSDADLSAFVPARPSAEFKRDLHDRPSDGKSLRFISGTITIATNGARQLRGKAVVFVCRGQGLARKLSTRANLKGLGKPADYGRPPGGHGSQRMD